MSKNIKFSLSAIEAKDLLAGDSNGFSDPYFKIPHHQNGVVDLPGKKNRTKVIKKTLNPVWNHTFEIEFNPQKCNKLNIEVFDYDIIGKDDPIGNATINLDWMISGGQDTFDQWIPLTVTIKDKNTKTKKDMQKGSVHVKIQVRYRPQIQGQPPMNSPIQGQPAMGQPPVYPQMGQPPTQPPMGQPPVQPTQGQKLMGQPIQAQHPLHQSMPPQFNGPRAFTNPPPVGQPLLQRPPTYNQQGLPPRPIQQSMMPQAYPHLQPAAYGPHYPAPAYGPHYQPAPIQQSMMAPHMMMPVMQQPAMMTISISPNIIMDFRRGDALQPGSWIAIKEPVVMVGLGWDFTGGKSFDLDASITGFDNNYSSIESIYFQKKQGLSGSVIHFGDNRTGKGEGDDEVIEVKLNKVPARVRYLAVTINSYTKNSIIKAKSAYIRLFTRNYHIGRYTLNRTKDCIGLLLGVFERDQTGMFWYFRVMADPIHGNVVTASIEDIKTLLGQYSMKNVSRYNPHAIHHPLPGEPIIQFNKWIKLRNRFTYVGLGWNIQQGMNFDLDASIITFDKMNRLLEIIYHKNGKSYNGSIIHYGDNRTGIGEGDDEVLSVDLAAIDPNAFIMAVVVNSFKGNSMSYVKDAFIRLYDTQAPIGVHVLNCCPDTIGLFFGIFRKDDLGVWYFTAIKELVNGIEAPQSVNDVILKLNKYPIKV